MNIIVESDLDGFPENDWIGSDLAVGDELRLHVIRPNARCVMTTLPQDDLPQDREIMTAMVRHAGVEMENGRRYPCAGVYASVSSGGTVKKGDLLSN